MAIDPPRLPARGTGPLMPGAIRPPVPQPNRAGMPAPIVPPPRVRAPGTTKLDPDVLKTQVRELKAPDEPAELKAPQGEKAIDQPEWVGVKRALADLPKMSAAKRKRLEVAVKKYARQGGDPKVAWGILMQIKQPFKRIGQAGSHTCAVTSPQQELARRAPARYFRIMKELAKDGGAMMKPGDLLQTGKANYESIMKRELPMNERLNLLFQTAGMEYANLQAKYDVDAGKSQSEFESFKGVGETGAEQFGQALLEGKSDLIGHLALRRRVLALKRDHQESGATVPPPGELRVRALRQLIEEGQGRGRESFFIKLKVPGGRHHFLLDKIDAEGVTLVDQRGARRLTNAQLAAYLTLEPGRGGYDPALAITGSSTAGGRPRPAAPVRQGLAKA